MLDLLSPLRGYIAQNLQFYLSKYIEDIQLEGLGLFGGDLVLNDLEIKRHVLRESLEIPSSFDFSRGFIRELRIHIPWTQLLSQPIEVKLYTIELILTAKSDDPARAGAAAAAGGDANAEPPPEDKIEQPKSGWIHDTLQKILANISVQVNNLVLKYEHDDVVFSIALGTLDFYSASESDGWKRNFEELGGGRRAICKRIDAKDVTIFLDRYTSEADAKDGSTRDRVRRNVVGYELPVLSRTSASVRAKLQLFPNAAAGRAQDGRRSRPTSPRSPLHQPPPTPSGVQDEGNIVDVDGLFGYRPSVMCDPFYYYSCNRSSVTPMHEVDIFIGELLFSVSDRQLEMLNQLIKSASSKIEQAHEPAPQEKNTHVASGRDVKAAPDGVATAAIPRKYPNECQKMDGIAKKRESWFGWAMNALGTAEDEEEDELVSELLAETRGALLRVRPPISDADEDALIASGPVTKTSCVRLCISSASLTLRKHEKEDQEVERQDAVVAENEEEFVPVANIGMVKVSRQTRRRKVARPAVPDLNLTMSYVALEMLLARGEEKSGTDLVFEIEKVELVSATASENREDSKCKKGRVLLAWGSIDSSHFSDCVSHPYFINSFFGEETTRLNQRETRSFEIVKVSLDADIPVWKTLEVGQGNSDESKNDPCECYTTWNGKAVRCIPIGKVSDICEQAIRIIGIKERVLDGGILSNAVSTSWASNNFPVSISEGMLRALTSIADEYRAHRSPDLGAQHNLTQLLQPQLHALFSRYTMHSCSAASLRASMRSGNVRHRSVHSALRLRLASTLTRVDRDELSANIDVRKETISKVLDISFGEAQAVLDPPKCVEILEAVSIILQTNKEGDQESENEVSVATTENASPSIQYIVQSDSKLVTASKVRIHLPDVPEKSWQDEGETRSRGGISLVGCDFSWMGTFYPGSSTNRVQLGAVSALLEKSHENTDHSAVAPLVEVLGVGLLITANSADGGDSDGLFASLDKLVVDTSPSSIMTVVDAIGGFTSTLGYPIPFHGTRLEPKTSKHTFRVEVCRATLSRSVSHRPRVAMAQRQSISAEIASISANVKKSNKKHGTHRILQGGVAPITIREENVGSSLFKCDIRQEKSRGVLREVPLLGVLPIFSLNPNFLSATCSQCLFVIDVQLAPLYVELKGLLHLTAVVLGLVNGITASLPVGKRSTPPHTGGQIVFPPNSTSTSWSLTLHLKAAGADILVNDALQLKIPSVSISSLDTEPNPPKQVQPRGTLKLECRMENARLCVSENGVLKGLLDPMLFGIGVVSISVDLSHHTGDHEQAYAIDMSVHVSNIQVSLSRLKLLYLFKLPFLETETWLISSPVRSSSSIPQSEAENNASLRYRWHLRLGVQLNRVDLVCTSNILQHRRSIRAVVIGEVSNLCVAIRFGNHHPTKSLLKSGGRHTFTDIQASVGDVRAVERLQPARSKTSGKFGEFSRLPEHAFLGILVCLDLADLICLSKSLYVSNANTPDSESLPSAMLSWNLTSNIARAFQRTSAEWHRREEDETLLFAEIPLVVSAHDPELTKSAHSYPLLSAFYRNYNEAGLAHYVIAGSMESADVALTTSSLCCLASVLKPSAGVTERKSLPCTADASDPAAAKPGPHDAASKLSLADIEVSLLLGQVRIIFPSEELMDSVLTEQSVVGGNIFIMLESLSMASAVRNEISLDGLGYPPFNSRVLPRRSNVQAQRFGQSQLRLGCRAGKLSGHVAALAFNRTGPKTSSGLGPFEEHIGQAAGCAAQFTAVETFWSPFNVTCSIEEEPFSTSEGDNSVIRTSVTAALTKLRFDLRKKTFDVLANRVVGITCGLGALSQSVTAPQRVKLKPVELTVPQKTSIARERTNQREIAFSCDGIEVNMLGMSTSTHVRVGCIVIVHNFSLLAGNASVQNVVVGHRATELPRSPTQKSVSSEEVVFGANVEPSLWQLAVENYPEKLIAARWNFGERTEGTLFLDMQAYQLHISHHFIVAISRFTQVNPEIAFSTRYPKEQPRERSDYLLNRHQFVFQTRWNIKLLVAPSVMSYWRWNPTKRGASGVWMTCGQVFASAGLGSDETAHQSLRTSGLEVNEINRFVAVPTLEMMLNVDKFGTNTSDELPPLEVHFRRSSIGPTSAHTGSTWQRFSKHISAVSEAQRLLHDCSIRITGDQQKMLERVALGETGVCLLHTEIARTSVQAEVNALCVKLSSFSLEAVQSLLAARGVYDDKISSNHDKQPANGEHSARAVETAIPRTASAENKDCSPSDDFKSLRRMAEGRRPSPGELVFTEALLIETQSAMSSGSPSPITGVKAQIQIDPNNYDIELADVAAYLKDCNGPWGIKDNSNVEGSALPGLGNKTHSWMGMRWCYHLPRSIYKIVANPVPIPPTGVPSGWPSWTWDQDEENDAKRLCDILCQLRCWDSKKSCYILVCEFYVPWERSLGNGSLDDADETYEPGSFGELMSQWFDDDMEKTRYRAKLLDFGSRARTLSFNTPPSSDNWELRWRSPLQTEQESENKQKRLVVNALLASSLQVNSTLDSDAYQRVVAGVTLPEVKLSVTHVGATNDTHDIITAELNDTVLSCAVSGSTSHTRMLNLRASSAMQVYLDNMAQLLTVSVIPRTTIDAMIESSSKGLEISTLIGPVSVYLNQTSILVLSAIPKLLQSTPKFIEAHPDDNFSSMRIRLVNLTGGDIWYRQEGTTESLQLAAHASAAYSWLSLANSPFYQLRFAVEDPSHAVRMNPAKTKQHAGGARSDDLCWCDPCRIKENAVTGRYFDGRGFLWICVELKGLQTIVTLRSPLTFRNFCDFPVRVRVNEDVHECSRSDELYEDTRIIKRSAKPHSNCISLDGASCTLSTSVSINDSVSRIMTESVSTLDFGVNGGPWCSVLKNGNIPNEFDLVKISDGQLDGLKKSQCSFAVLHPGDPEEPTKYVWVKVDRAQCKTVLPTDFDPLQPQVSRRYTWMGVSLWPAITVENSMDIPVSFSFFQKDVRIGLNVHPSSEKSTSALNPFEPMDVQFLYEGHQGSSHTPTKPIKFSLVSSAPDTETKEQIFEFGVCRVVATVSNDHRPTMRIRTERALSVANMTPSALRINIDSPLRQHGTVEKVASCEERSVGFSVASKCLVVSIATDEATRDRGDEMEWSPEITLNVNGDTKPVVVPPDETGLRSLASAYCVELANRGGYLKLTIRPQVVVINSTNCNLKFTPTDGRGNSLAAEDELSLLSGEDEGWSVPVCLHKEAKKRSITADVSSWLSSKLSRRPSTDLSNPAKQALVARVSCSFRVSLAEDGYEWTEEIAVLLPKIPLLLSSDGKLKIVEPQTSSTTPPNTPECLYPAPSTTTHRRRLLIRHRDFRHKMLTYTMTQTHKCIHIMFFVDHQAPVIIHNQWENVLGFRNVAFPSDPEGVGSNYYLEYDWGLQVPTKQQALREEDPKIDNNDTKSDTELLRDWLEASMQSTERVSMPDNTSGERMRFQIGSPRYGWSNALWQVGGIQFASFSEEEGSAKSGPTFLVMCFYRAGSWLISITCLEDPTHEGHSGTTPSLVLPSMTIPTKVEQAAPVFLKLGVIVEELSLHFCDEHDPVRDARGLISYPEILRATCNAVSIVFATAPDPPEVSRHSTRLGYLSHIRSYTTLFVGVEDIEGGHFLRTCNFPVILCFTETHGSKDLLQFDRVKKHEGLANLMGKLLDKQLPGADKSSLATRIIYTDTWDPVGIPSYFHSIELKLAPAVLQVEDDILTYMNAFIRPMLDALEGEAASARVASIQQNQPPTISKSAWSMTALESAAITKQRKVYIERLEISTLQVTITARVSIPVLNSFDGTPLHFGSTEMREVFAFPDQLYKDLAADYVADTIVRSPMLLMSLNIIGNPAGFVRSFGQGVRDLVEIPLAASRNGYSPWVLTKGVVGGVASFLGHATAATLTSVSGFSYSFSRTMDQLTLPSDQLKKRHYTRPTQLSSALASGLGSLGSSVVGAAAGVITTPIAVYKERQMQGLDNGLRSVVGGVGMGLVGIVARPMGGVASLVSMTSDGLLYGMGGNRAPFDDSVSRFNARQNELLRYKLKVLPDAIGSSLAFAHGVWVVGDENKLVTPGQEFDGISEEQLEAPENEALRCLVLPADRAFRLVQVTVVCSNECLYVVGMRGAQNQAVLVRTSLESIQAVEESLKEPTIFDLGVKTPASVEWLRFRLPPRQRRHLSHQLRLWLANDAIL